MDFGVGTIGGETFSFMPISIAVISEDRGGEGFVKLGNIWSCQGKLIIYMSAGGIKPADKMVINSSLRVERVAFSDMTRYSTLYSVVLPSKSTPPLVASAFVVLTNPSWWWGGL